MPGPRFAMNFAIWPSSVVDCSSSRRVPSPLKAMKEKASSPKFSFSVLGSEKCFSKSSLAASRFSTARPIWLILLIMGGSKWNVPVLAVGAGRLGLVLQHSERGDDHPPGIARRNHGIDDGARGRVVRRQVGVLVLAPLLF